MQLAKIIAPDKHLLVFLFLLFSFAAVRAQDNSPYSRYALGNEMPHTNITNRGMGGISAGYTDYFSVNYSNPASYAGFMAIMEQRSKKVSSARVILDAGINLSSRTLSQPNTTKSFTSSDALFSHVYVGIPIRHNWGIAFGIRPVSRISYDVFRSERLKDPVSNQPIDSAFTRYTGTGGTYLPTIGTGFGSDHLTVGFNVGYLFGNKSISTRRNFINDSVAYAAADYTTNSTFGNVFFNAGLQYRINIDKTSLVRFGAAGNWKQTISGSQDVQRQTYVLNSIGQQLQVDSVYQKNGVSGDIIYPASYTAGVYYQKDPGLKTRGFSAGVDYVMSQWSDYRFFGATDLVQNSWELRVGGQLSPVGGATRYSQNITYRFGAFAGTDNIRADKSLPIYGVSFGAGLPIFPSRQSPYQFSIINLALEYTRRGNDNNVIKENMFRLSIGLNFTDMWFGKRKYD